MNEEEKGGWPPAACGLCPRRCGADRRSARGRCHGGAHPRIARAAPHYWEEPCISGTRGSGAVFFTGCPLGCVFCQNAAISRGEAGRKVSEEELAEIFLDLQARGVHNLNLVTAGHWRTPVLRALAKARQRGLWLPAVWNTGGYETPRAVEELAEAIDVWLFDLKFHSPWLSAALAGAPDYFDIAFAALRAALAAAGPPRFDAEELLQKGLVLRILVLPGFYKDAVRLLQCTAGLGPQNLLLSLMSQYTPPKAGAAGGGTLPKSLLRPLAAYEYRKTKEAALGLGFERGYFQRRGSAREGYVPPFEL